MTTVVRKVLADHPLFVNVAILAIVLAHLGAGHLLPVLDVAGYFRQVEPSNLAGAFGTVATLAALLAGFSGVVVVFGLQADGDRFRRMRINGGQALRAIWIGTIASALLAAFAAVTGSIASLLLATWAPWILELALLWCAHAALRQVWLLHHLARAVLASDTDVDSASRVIPLNQMRRVGRGA